MSTELAILDANQMHAAIEYAEKLSHSLLIPDDYKMKPANVLWAIEYGRTLGLTPLAAINGVNVIKGKPTASAALISALVRRAGHRFRSGFDKDTMTGWATVVRSDDPDFTFRSEWDLERAVDAELCQIVDGKPFAKSAKGESLPWKKFFPSMVKARATTEVARDACEEVLFGLHYTPEELGAEVDDDGKPVTGGVVYDIQTRQVVAEAEDSQLVRHHPDGAKSHQRPADEWTQPAAADGIEDAEGVPEEPTRFATDEQGRELSELFASELGITDRRVRLERISETFGFVPPITTTKQLTFDQAATSIRKLREFRDRKIAREQTIKALMAGIDLARSDAEFASVVTGIGAAFDRQQISEADRAELIEVLDGARRQQLGAEVPQGAEQGAA